MRGLEVGGVDYVTKPIVVDEMIARIRVHLANARLAQSARAALDVAGRYLFAVDRQGRLLWSTSQAQKLLDESRETGGAQFKLSAAQLKWLLQAVQEDSHAPADWNAQTRLRLFYLGKLAPGELLLRLAYGEQSITPADLRKELGLTSRESEVLSWISKGKTNRDIAQILGLSPARSTSISSKSTPNSASRTGLRPQHWPPRPTRTIERASGRRNSSIMPAFPSLAAKSPRAHLQTPASSADAVVCTP